MPEAVPPAEPAAPRAAATLSMPVLRAVLLFAVFVVALELTCRIDDLIRFDTPFFSRLLSQSDLAVRDAQGTHGRPNSRFQKWQMNNLGMRGPDVPPVPAPGTLRVIAAGASETFGLYESPDGEYPRQLEDSLGSLLARSACAEPRVQRAEVLNAALPGMSLPTITQDMRLRLAGLRPDVVFLYATPVQYLDEEPPVATPPTRRATAGGLGWERAAQPRAWFRVRDQAKQTIPSFAQTWLRRRDTERQVAEHPAGWRFSSIPEARLTQFETDLRAAVGTIRAIGATPVLATHANAFIGTATSDAARLASWERFYPRAPGAVILAFDSAAREVTLRVARDSGVVAADLAGATAGDKDKLFADFSHFTNAGAATVGGILAPAVLRALPAGRTCDAAAAAPRASKPIDDARPVTDRVSQPAR